jgi:hypothetical protein
MMQYKAFLEQSICTIIQLIQKCFAFMESEGSSRFHKIPSFNLILTEIMAHWRILYYLIFPRCITQQFHYMRAVLMYEYLNLECL